MHHRTARRMDLHVLDDRLQLLTAEIDVENAGEKRFLLAIAQDLDVGGLPPP
jgi:hypothetical protein